MTYCYLDCETLGLSLERHDIWEIAYAFGDEPITSGFVPHRLLLADSTALEMNRYYEREGFAVDMMSAMNFEMALIERLQDERPVIVGSNPNFDMARLSRRWGGIEPWAHRVVDVPQIVVGPLGLTDPVGLARTVRMLRDLDYDVPEPNHTAAGDVESARVALSAIRDLQDAQRAVLYR